MYRVPCLYPLSFTASVIRELEYAGLDSLLLKSILIVQSYVLYPRGASTTMCDR